MAEKKTFKRVLLGFCLFVCCCFVCLFVGVFFWGEGREKKNGGGGGGGRSLFLAFVNQPMLFFRSKIIDFGKMWG